MNRAPAAWLESTYPLLEHVCGYRSFSLQALCERLLRCVDLMFRVVDRFASYNRILVPHSFPVRRLHELGSGDC